MDVELENWRKRLIFRSGHRGTKEMDLIMGNFALQHVPNFNQEELTCYEDLLLHNDPDLYNWLTGKEEAPEDVRSPVYEKLAAYTYK